MARNQKALRRLQRGSDAEIAAAMPALFRQWRRTGGASWAKRRLSEARRLLGDRIPDLSRPTPLPPAPEDKWIVFLPKIEAAREQQMAFAARGPVAVSNHPPSPRAFRRRAGALLREVLGDRGLVWGNVDRPPAGPVTFGLASVTMPRPEPVVAERYDEINAIIASGLGPAQVKGLEAAGAVVIRNEIVGLPQDPAGAGGSGIGAHAEGAASVSERFWHLIRMGVMNPDGTRPAAIADLDMSSVLIGIIDTGIDGTHPEFEGRIDWFEAFGRNVKHAGEIRDYGMHGTHVAALAAGSTCGVAPRARLAVAAALTLPEGRGELSDVTKAMAALKEVARQRRKRLVLSLSMSTAGHSRNLLQPIGDQVVAGEAVIFAAIGNDGAARNLGGSPGDYGTVFGIGATDRTDTIAAFSAIVGIEGQPGRGKPDFYAPGVGIYSAVPHRKYEAWNGTSMATPLAAGLAALYVAQGRRGSSLFPRDIAAELRAGAVSVQAGDRTTPDLPNRFRVRYHVPAAEGGASDA